MGATGMPGGPLGTAPSPKVAATKVRAGGACRQWLASYDATNLKEAVSECDHGTMPPRAALRLTPTAEVWGDA